MPEVAEDPGGVGLAGLITGWVIQDAIWRLRQARDTPRVKWLVGSVLGQLEGTVSSLPG